MLLRETVVSKLIKALDRRTVKVNTLQDLAKLITDTIEQEAEAIVLRKAEILANVPVIPAEVPHNAENSN